MTDINSPIVRLIARNDHLDTELRLKGGDGGGTYDGMETRVTKLETHFEYIRRDLDEVKAGQSRMFEKLDSLSDSVRQLPTKNDLWQWKVQWTALVVAAIALIVGGIIGGLSWIKPDPAPVVQPAPVVVYQPTPAAETPPTPPQQ